MAMIPDDRPMKTSDAPPSRAASSRLPSPRVRDTSADVAMVRPMDTDIVKNISVPAKPMAAASSSTPRSEM